jgi:hypothetical protein
MYLSAREDIDKRTQADAALTARVKGPRCIAERNLPLEHDLGGTPTRRGAALRFRLPGGRKSYRAR